MNTPRTDICRPEDREAVLTERRRMKMACSAHSYVRGSTLKFYEWLGLSHSAIFTAGSARLDLRRLPSGKLGPCGRRQGPSEDCYQGPGPDGYRKSCPRSHSPGALAGNCYPGVGFARGDDRAHAGTRQHAPRKRRFIHQHQYIHGVAVVGFG